MSSFWVMIKKGVKYWRTDSRFAKSVVCLLFGTSEFNVAFYNKISQLPCSCIFDNNSWKKHKQKRHSPWWAKGIPSHAYLDNFHTIQTFPKHIITLQCLPWIYYGEHLSYMHSMQFYDWAKAWRPFSINWFKHHLNNLQWWYFWQWHKYKINSFLV